MISKKWEKQKMPKEWNGIVIIPIQKRRNKNNFKIMEVYRISTQHTKSCNNTTEKADILCGRYYR